MDQAALQRVTLARSSGTLCCPGRPWAPKAAHMDREFLVRIGWYPAGPLGGWVEFVLDSKAEPLGCVAMHCRYCTETKTLGKHLNSSASIFSAWRPLTVHVWEIALQLHIVFYWLCILCQDCSPFRPGTVFMSTQWRTWLVADHDWSPTLPYVTVLATATELLPAGGAAQ